MDSTGFFAGHVDNQLGLPFELLDDLSVREQRVIVKRRIQELREIENFKIRTLTKSPTKPIDTNTNTKLYLRQMGRNQLNLSQTVANSTIQTNFDKRSRSNIPYLKKPRTTRSDMSDNLFGDETTAATASPTTFRQQALSIGGSDMTKLHEVSEIPFPKNAVTNTYRKQRLLAKGCTKLIRQVEKYQGEIDRSILKKNALSAKLAPHIMSDRVKMSIMSTRTNALDSPLRHNLMDEHRNFSGFNTSKNAYEGHSLAVSRHRNAPNFPSMVLERSNVTSELHKSSK